MATKIRFDKDYNLIEPTVILSRRNGDKLGKIPAEDLRYARNLNKANELRFTVYKDRLKYIDDDGNEQYYLWEDITDFKLVYLREYDEFFELYVNLNDDGGILSKDCSLISLAEAELSQINVGEIEFNTENDIELDDYEPRVLYNKSRNKSMLTLLLEKAPHYTIGHVDVSLQDIQRTFSFDSDLYDCLQEIAEEIECIFIFDNGADNEGKPKRRINVYDLKNHCVICNKRGDFSATCSECGSHEISEGYGEDTTIFFNNENLAESIVVTSNTDSVKNCFTLEAGDDLFTATLRNCNPNGSAQIWNISDYMKQDMSPELVSRLAEYDTLYAYYLNDYQPEISADMITLYNELVRKYKTDSNDLERIPTSIIGYTALMQAYYNTLDFYLYIHDSMMPELPDGGTSAITEASKLNSITLSPVSVSNINTASKYTVENSIQGLARAIVDQRYKVEVVGTSYMSNRWQGYIVITSYSNEEDTITTPTIDVDVNSDYETFVNQKLKILLGEKNEIIASMSDLFKSSISIFTEELKKYGIVPLQTIDSCCQSCLDVLILQGVADKKSDMYSLYQNYYERKKAIELELRQRTADANIIVGETGVSGKVISNGVQTIIENARNFIQDQLNFSAFLGDDLWNEFSSFRRDDKYSNTNFASDGLTTTQLFKQAAEFMETAKKDILKSSTLQHSIKSSLQNLLAIKEFEPLKDYFEVGNYLRTKVDGEIYKLRLIHFETDFKDQLDTEFSDVINSNDIMSDAQDILDQAQSMATSYDVVKRQASQGKSATSKYREWVNKGLSLTQVKIVNNAENQDIQFDEHGLLGRELNPINGDYDDKQLKLINRGIYYTDDAWKSVKSAVGDFVFWNPKTGQIEESYGVIAQTLIGNYILSEETGIFNESGSVEIGPDGFVMTTDKVDNPDNTLTFIIQKKYLNDNDEETVEQVMYVDDEGNLNISGNILVNNGGSSQTLNSLTDIQRITEYVDDSIGEFSDIQNDRWDNLNAWVRILPAGIVLGETGNPLQLQIQNNRISYVDGGVEVAYFNNQKLYVTDIEVTTNLFLGNFAFVPRSNGSLDFKKVK